MPPRTAYFRTILSRPAEGTKLVELARVRGNHPRLRRHAFPPVKARAIRLHVHATNGDKLARVFGVRCHGQGPRTPARTRATEIGPATQGHDKIL